jgi:hypothetical protein
MLRPGFSRAAACPMTAMMLVLCSVLVAQKTLSDEVCDCARAAFTAPLAIMCLPYA